MKRLVLGLLLALVLLIAGFAAAGYFWIRTSLPQTTGRIALAGLTAPVRIIRDAHGIPTIIAANEHDADFALGFVHAQDRLFAMDVMRHYGAGRLSEWFGRSTLPIDRVMRTLGIYRAAARQYHLLSPALRATLDAYAAGVNAYLATRHGALPPEYYILGVRPAPWRPADSLVWAKLMDLALTGNYRGELLRARLLRHISAADLATLFPPYPKDGPVVLQETQALLRRLPLGRLYALMAPVSGPEHASNNWVLSGAHTVSGKPLLANDPHLDFSAPGIWYLVRIEIPGLTLAGVTAPGNPYIVIGHNQRIAWGFTTTGSDVEDLFIEKPVPGNPARYLAPGGSLPFVTRTETIRVRHGAPVTLTVRATRHGPVISDVIPGSHGAVLALAATWLAPDDRTPQALWAMNHAMNWTQFKAALRDWTAPQQNIVYADVDGHIGFIAPARIPIRAKGEGWLPAPGWSGAYDWTGTVPFDALPQAFDPPSGRIVTANNKIVADDYPYFLTRAWAPPQRAERITQLLDAIPRQSPQTTAAIQDDDLSLVARDLLPLMLKLTPGTPTRAPALERLRAWNGRMDRSAVAPLLFVAWLRALNREVLAPRLGDAFFDYWNLHPEVMRLILTAHPDWCDDPATPRVESCGEALARALDRALAGLAARYGTDMGAWQWGQAHRALFTNALWAHVPVLGDWINLSIPADGGDDTVDAGVMAIADHAAPFADRHGPTLRMIVDLVDPAAARFMITPGESGNPLSPHWRDLMLAWRNAATFAFSQDRTGGVLELMPR